MKFFVVVAALVAAVAAVPAVDLKPTTSDMTELEAVYAAIASPYTDPATAALLEAQLVDIVNSVTGLGQTEEVAPIIPESGISVGPAIVSAPESEATTGISFAPAIVSLPAAPVAPVTPAIVAPAPVATPTPVTISDASGSPLVQIILNINQASAAATPVVSPVAVATPAIVESVVPASVESVSVAESSPAVETVSVADSAPIVASPALVAAPENVNIVGQAPEAVAVAAPIAVAPVVAAPQTLN